MASGDTKTEAMLNALGNGGSADEFRGCCNTKTQSYILDAIDRVQNIEDEVEELKNNPDVVDIVDTHADLQAYDTQHLTENDIIRVLQDETHSGNSTYYRFTRNPDTWTFIGEISGGSSVNVVQTIGASTTDVMSQNAVASMVFADPSAGDNIKIGSSTSTGSNQYNISIGSGARSLGLSATAVGPASYARGTGAVAIGVSAGDGVNNRAGAVSIGNAAKAKANGAIAIGSNSEATSVGEMNIGTTSTSEGYSSSNYRLISGVYDGQSAHDAVTVGQINDLIDAINTATGANISHIGS